jgi:hypothetical protein
MEPTFCLCHALGVWFCYERLAYPNQNLAILIDGKPLPFDELKREVLQLLGIELELPLERAVSQAPSTLEHGDRLVQHLFKPHSAFSSRAVLSKNVDLGGQPFYTRFRPEKQWMCAASGHPLFWTPLIGPVSHGLHRTQLKHLRQWTERLTWLEAIVLRQPFPT